ncbi:SDR family NAD(P)-dependent oxidoreductase [Streptomyces gilvus]|uniref:SDR family NAD(P)-dependent oxidoreductase n=1 Tax=Streptomyces gilvus TaxID=2920937 RepID=UPI001F0CF877|nr:SDR family NAD(P)-dependent oxidoreductase [Streptomyces sp. CME 23]MCH5671432.1 SDR family oxidoreductase [Streptomyces sp. CME 23]
MRSRMAGRTVLVTGATGGIGDAVVRRLAGEGAAVVVTDLDAGRCEQLAQEVGGGALGLALDVSDEAAWQQVVAEVTARRGELSVLVNNAGIAGMNTVVTETMESWEQVLGVTQTGVWLGMKHAGPSIERAGGGSIVNVASIFGTVGGFGAQFSYHAAKGAVRLMTKNAALYWAKRGVRVNSLHPGFIETPRSRELWRGTPRLAAMLEGTPLGRLGTPEEVAAAVAFLASDESSFMTGSELYVDGGWTAR